ncbi:LAS superfamily LD-carboxypeptidase LdcB [Oceanisphaera litoralis]|uniref:M15 family metallopeptidase n=1 Tax=Oceanisphaera litoralis TaxID=225144 RepID=UPI0019594AC2|nr:M15 family metallopeptidase [Oceanisphaera litoralis]MBM7454308.1 LAS superfamily LD-carboxypeptidase LdcB [Oceanisphaera litoralis]
MKPLCLLGLSEAHLVALNEPGHRLQAEARDAFMAMQAAAAEAGFQLMPASSFRSFERQLAIWNGKFEGSRPLLDADSRPLDALALSAPERVHAILHWSALPGTSRHHWGTDLDIYDPTLLPPGKKLQLEPWEYEPGGYFYPLSQWLAANRARFGFYLPYQRDLGGVAIEPWHLSYRPQAADCAGLLTPSLVADTLRRQPVAGKAHILKQLDEIFARYITTTPED